MSIEVTAELTAAVLRVVVDPGAHVDEGDSLLIVESMKMEIPVLAPRPGIVRAIHVAPQQLVSEGDVLAVLDPSVSP